MSSCVTHSLPSIPTGWTVYSPHSDVRIESPPQILLRGAVGNLIFQTEHGEKKIKINVANVSNEEQKKFANFIHTLNQTDRTTFFNAITASQVRQKDALHLTDQEEILFRIGCSSKNSLTRKLFLAEKNAQEKQVRASNQENEVLERINEDSRIAYKKELKRDYQARAQNPSYVFDTNILTGKQNDFSLDDLHIALLLALESDQHPMHQASATAIAEILHAEARGLLDDPTKIDIHKIHSSQTLSIFKNNTQYLHYLYTTGKIPTPLQNKCRAKNPDPTWLCCNLL